MADTVVIIGAGLAGLATGCYAQLNGYHTHIIEHHTSAGGVATAWRRRNYLFDGGIHVVPGRLPGTKLHQVYNELGITPGCRFLEVKNYARFVDESTGRRLDFGSDLEQLAHAMQLASPTDAKVIESLLAGAEAMRGLDMTEPGMSRVAIGNSKHGFKDYWHSRKVGKYLGGKYAKPIMEFAGRIEDAWLRHILQSISLPESPTWSVLLLMARLADGELALVEGGCTRFVGPLVDRYMKLGGEITYGSDVNGVLIDRGRATGVQLSDGRQHLADAVVSAGDGYHAMLKMLGGRFADAKMESRYKEARVTRPLVILSFGVVREFPGEPWLSILRLAQPFTVGGKTVDCLKLRILNYSDQFASSGRTVVQVLFETDWDHWNELRRERKLYQAEKDRVAGEVLSRLDAHYPGISSLVEVTDVATPYTTWRYTLNYHGAFMGWLPDASAMKDGYPRTLPGLASFYMAGQWVMPSGGVAAALFSGRRAVELLCRKDKKQFSAEPA